MEFAMKVKLFSLLAGALLVSPAFAGNLGLPDVPVPMDNPQTMEKIALGDKLFNDTRFSSTGEVSCASCHDPLKGGTDSPLKTSEGINGLTGTRNAPPVMNAAFNKTQFWDGRSPSLEDQARHPFINPVEMGLPSHDPIIEIVSSDADYLAAFEAVFGVGKGEIMIDHVTQAIAAFERTQVGGESAWDRWYFGGEEEALGEAAKRGFQVFLAEGRCISCHAIEQDFAVFTDHLFHNIGVGINDIQPQVPALVQAFLAAKAEGADVDVTVLSNPDVSHLGRFVVDEQLSSLGAFKTPTLRNIALTAPYMHDGSLATLRDVVVHYNNGGVIDEGDPINPFLSGGIRPLNLTEDQIDDLVAFMEALTSADLETQQAMTTGDGGKKRVANSTGSSDVSREESDT
jgi:cytochrome c peroxidase